MPSKKETSQTQTTQFDPAALAAYQQNIGVGSSALRDLIADPLKSTFFNSQLNLMRGQSSRQGQTNVWQALNNQGLGGGSGYNPLTASLLTRLRRGQTANESAGFHNLLLNAAQARQQGIGQALSFQPLQTGAKGTSIEKTSGVGTWLPQLISSGIGAATAFASGGASLAAGRGGGFGGGGSLPNYDPSAPLGRPPAYTSGSSSGFFKNYPTNNLFLPSRPR